MSIPYIQSTISQARCVDGCFISYPFIESGDTATKVYNMTCIQLAEDYSASQLDLDDPMTNATTAGVMELPDGWGDPVAYFVGDTNHASLSGGLVSFTRTFANIPKTVTVSSGSQAYAFPGILQGNLTIESLAMTYVTTPTDTMTITTTSPHGLGEGDIVQIRNLFFTKDGTSDYIAYSADDEYTNYTATSVTSTSFIITTTALGFDQQYDLELTSGEVRNPESFAYDISNVAVNLAGNGLVVTTSEVNTIDAGQRLTCVFQFSEGSNPFVHSVSGQFNVISAPSDTTFIIDVGLFFDLQSVLNIVFGGRVLSTGYSRDETSYKTPIMTRYQYILPGVTPGITDPTDVVIPESFKVTSGANGELKNVVANASVTERAPGLFYAVWPTLPTASEYISMIGSGANLVIESSLSVWAGNILLLKTKTCKAR